MKNMFQNIPNDLSSEVFEDLIKHNDVRIERIISKGHSSPDQGWYDQEEHEWVMVLQGAGTLEFEDGSTQTLKAGDYLNIPAHTKHKVSWTDPDQITIWLAVFYRD
ncbi:cupin domain-containing protein [Litoribrevibacter euphylliae]|uniref:Cupin domain-containing protein n=1 Tax=Litoribrevibacter euphylliae TaxID=1834034 RepID=A0ABV7HH89_9GAMM